MASPAVARRSLSLPDRLARVFLSSSTKLMAVESQSGLRTTMSRSASIGSGSSRMIAAPCSPTFHFPDLTNW